MAKYNLTLAQIKRLRKAYSNYSKKKKLAKLKYGDEYVEPSFEITETEVTTGLLQPGNSNEYRRLVRYLDGTKEEHFKAGRIKGSTEADLRLARSVSRASNKIITERKATAEANIERYDETIKQTSDRYDREALNTQRQAERQRLNTIEAQLKYDPMTALTGEQLASRVRARLTSTYSGGIQFANERYQRNYLMAMLKNGLHDTLSPDDTSVVLSELNLADTLLSQNLNELYADGDRPVNNVFARLNNMSPDDFVKFVEANPQLQMKEFYLDNGGEILSEIMSALVRWGA